MRTKTLFTALLLGISMSAFCVTAKDYFQLDPPNHIYGGAILDSMVEAGSWGEYHILYDDKARMVEHRMFELDRETQQLTYNGVSKYTYADANGIIYSACNQQMWNPSKEQWEDYKIKFDGIAYDASGNPIKWSGYLWNDETHSWEIQSVFEAQYDTYGNIVLMQDSVWTHTDSVDSLGNIMSHESSWSVFEESYKYEYDKKGRVLVEWEGHKSYETGEMNYSSKVEYTYNAHGDLQTEKRLSIRRESIYDEETWEFKDSTWWEIGSTVEYHYNAFSNLEKKIEYDREGEEEKVCTYYYSLPSSTTEVENAAVTATPGDNYSVILQWPAVAGADSYTLDIRKNGELSCTLIFNAQGQLTGISFAPARGGARTAQTAAQTTGGWQYKLEGLEADTEYSYTATAKKNELVLSAQTVFFTTSLQALEDLYRDSDKQGKIFRNGQILILRGDKTYTLQGQEVR